MRAQDYPLEHFKLMVDILTGLANLPVQILEHSYTYESFGSWWFTFRRPGQQYRVVFDGKDSYLSIQLLNGKDWEDILSTKLAKLSANDIINNVLSAIKTP